MDTPLARDLIDTHRDLCAAIRRADQACGRLYSAPAASPEAARCESEYLEALERAREVLDGLRAVLAGAPHPDGRIALHGTEATRHA